MGTADRSGPAKVPRLSTFGRDSKKAEGSGSAAMRASERLPVSKTVSIGGDSPGPEKQRVKTSPPVTRKNPAPARGRMATLLGGMDGPAEDRTKAPESKRKLQPVPLPWQRPEQRAPQPDPAVLLVGADETFLPAIEKALARHKVFVETTDPDTIVETVVAAAPDLVMLMGAAARDCGNEVLGHLAQSPQSAVVPVVILDDDTVLDARLRAFRHGAAAVIPRSASVDAIADQVAKLAREIPERHGSALGEVGDTTLEELVQTLATQLRSGILSVSAGQGKEAEAVRLVLGQGRPLADLIDDFVVRARKHVLAAEPLRYEFDEHISGTVQVLDAAGSSEDETPRELGEVRIALADADAARADNIAQELRSLGATVVVTDLEPSELRFARMRQVDPTILLIGESHVHSEGYELVRRMRRDTRLRWASLLVVRWDDLWSETDAAPKTAVQRLAGTLAALAEPENSVRQRAEEPHGFDTRLEITGPARCLRALTGAGTSIRVLVSNPRISVEIDIGNQLVVGASAASVDGSQRWEAAAALSAFMQLSSGRVHVEPVQNPATANVMTTIDVALNMADAEPPPIAPSLPAEPGDSPPPSVSPPPAASVRGLQIAEPVQALVVPGGPDTAATGALRPGWVRNEVARRGISPLTATLLVGLAIMQGLLVVFLWRSLGAERRSIQGATDSGVPVAPTTSATGRAKSTVAAAPVAAVEPAASAPVAKLPQAVREIVPPVHSDELPRDDASGHNAPTCEELWAEHPPRAGSYPGAAFQKSRDANRWITRGDLDQAQHAYCLAVRWDAQNVGFLVGLGHLMLLRRDGDQAVPLLRRALELNADSTRAAGLLGDALARTGEYESAREQWLLSSGHQKTEKGALEGLAKRDLKRGERHARRHEWTQAERMFRRAVVMSPKRADAAVGLSRTLIELDDAKPAVVWAKYAIALDPRHTEAHLTLGDALAKLGDVEGAKVEWQEVRLLDPTHEGAQKRMRLP